MGVKIDLSLAEAAARVYDPGEVIFRSFDMGAEMYVVLDGAVELSIGSNVVETLGPGEPFGEMALIDQTPRVATATAKTATRLAVITERRFLFLVQTAPEFSLQIMKVMADRLRKMNARLPQPVA